MTKYFPAVFLIWLLSMSIYFIVQIEKRIPRFIYEGKRPKAETCATCEFILKECKR